VVKLFSSYFIYQDDNSTFYEEPKKKEVNTQARFDIVAMISKEKSQKVAN